MILSLLTSPSAYWDHPKGFVRNQFLHAYLVAPVLLLFLPLWGVAVLYLAWELVQYLAFDAEAWDCCEDAGHVLLIAVAIDRGVPELVPVQLLFLAAGYGARVRGTKPKEGKL